MATVVAECPEKLRGHTSADERLDSEEARAKYPDALVVDNRYVNEGDRLAGKH